jgi:hypothetical protein
MPILAKDWYEQEPDLTSFYQGDIIRDVPIIFLPDKISKWFILRPGGADGKKHIDNVLRGEICKWFQSFPEGQLKDAWTYGEKEEYVAAKAFLVNVVILTQTCDIENRGYYQIAPIYPETKQKPSALDNLRQNYLNYAFYLPAVAPYVPENSYADLAHTCVAPKAFFPRDSVGMRLAARLTDFARASLQAQIAHYFGRPFGFSARDRARVTAEYACISCFYRVGSCVKKQFQAGANFTPCDTCREALWIRVPPA